MADSQSLSSASTITTGRPSPRASMMNMQVSSLLNGEMSEPTPDSTDQAKNNNTAANDPKKLPQNAIIQKAMDDCILGLQGKLSILNNCIYMNPELAFKEHIAHSTICDFLEGLGYQVTRHAYGMQTAFEATAGSGGRTVNFNAEYDALPGMGHACGHNLIASAGVAAFIALSHVLHKFGIKGRVQLLGTPAEEDGGGKINLLNAGAYKKVDVSLMMHPMSEDDYKRRGVMGSAGFSSVASYILRGTYSGVSAHAGATPWEGTNALDALVSAYVNVSLLRQQILPQQRIHGAIVEAPKPTSNAIPALTRTEYTTRSATIRGAKNLGARVRKCMEAGALAAGCALDIDEKAGYADLRVNEALCVSFQKNMAAQGVSLLQSEGLVAATTDQGNVSYEVPALHAIIGIPVSDRAKNHTPGFAKAAGTVVAFERALVAGKGLAMTGWDVLTDNAMYERVKQDFEKDKGLR